MSYENVEELLKEVSELKSMFKELRDLVLKNVATSNRNFKAIKLELEQLKTSTQATSESNKK